MDTLIRAPRLVEEKRILLLGGRAPEMSVVESIAPDASPATVRNVAEMKQKMLEREQAHFQLKAELEQARARLQAFEAGIETEFERAREQGFAAGQKQGVEHMESGWRERLERLQAIIESAARSREQIARANEGVIAEIVYAATLRMVGSQAASVESIRHVVAEIIGDPGAAAPVRLRVARRDVELVEDMVAGLFPSGGGWPITGDDNVVLGGCIIEQQSGSLDARLETQLEALRRAVLKPFVEAARD